LRREKDLVGKESFKVQEGKELLNAAEGGEDILQAGEKL